MNYISDHTDISTLKGFEVIAVTPTYVYKKLKDIGAGNINSLIKNSNTALAISNMMDVAVEVNPFYKDCEEYVPVLQSEDVVYVGQWYKKNLCWFVLVVKKIIRSCESVSICEKSKLPY